MCLFLFSFNSFAMDPSDSFFISSKYEPNFVKGSLNPKSLYFSLRSNNPDISDDSIVSKIFMKRITKLKSNITIKKCSFLNMALFDVCITFNVNDIDLSLMFNNCDHITDIRYFIIGSGLNNVNLSYMFSKCTSLVSLHFFCDYNKINVKIQL